MARMASSCSRQSRTSSLDSAIRSEPGRLCVNHRLVAEIAEKEDFLRAVSHDLNAPLRNICERAKTAAVITCYADGERRYDVDPGTGAAKRAWIQFLTVLPIEWLL